MAVAVQARPAARPRARSHRFTRLLVVGLIDSFGMTFGWTVFCLLLLEAGGLVAVGVCNAAMLVGVALSAPVTAWLSGRLTIARLLRWASSVEALLRVASFLLLLAGAPVAVLAAVIAVMYTAGLAAYACMRAEVSAASRAGREGATMTLFVVAVMAAEAAGVACAALLPGDPPGAAGLPLAAVVAGYGLSQLPTWLVARDAQVGRARRGAAAGSGGSDAPVLLAGGLVMLLGSGPALLAVGLAAELHGPRWVAGSALGFTAGALLAPWAVALVERLRLPTAVTWPTWGAGMLLGWVVAPSGVAGLLAAQVLAGLCIAAFEGGMDAQVAARGDEDRLMGSLAASEAVRALGSALAVAALPPLVGLGGVSAFSAAAGAALLAAVLVGLAVLCATRLAAGWRRPAVALATAGAATTTGHPLPVRPTGGLVFDWRHIRMEPRDPRLPQPPDDWARMLKEARPRRRRPLHRVAVALLLVVVGAVMFQVGQASVPTIPAGAHPAPAGPDPYTAPAPTIVISTTAPSPSPAPAAAAPRPRLLRLTTDNIGTEADPNRVYLVPGQVDAAQAAKGRRPELVVRPGEAVRVRVANQDRYVHSFTFAKARVNLDIFEGTVASATFKAPTAPGTYQFYCRYRKVGMSGTLVVRGGR
jgi:plastocyanin